MRYGLLEKQTYPERTLHVEYHLTRFGQGINRILDQIDTLQRERNALFEKSQPEAASEQRRASR